MRWSDRWVLTGRRGGLSNSGTFQVQRSRIRSEVTPSFNFREVRRGSFRHSRAFPDFPEVDDKDLQLQRSRIWGMLGAARSQGVERVWRSRSTGALHLAHRSMLTRGPFDLDRKPIPIRCEIYPAVLVGPQDRAA